MERNSLNPKKVCEVGCGAGKILYFLSLSLPDCVFYGCDISPQAIEMAEEIKSDRIHFSCTAFPAGHFDTVLVIDVVEHIPDYFSFLQRVKELGETKIFHLPLDLSILNLLRPHFFDKARAKSGHLHYWAAESALWMLMDAGYEIVDSFYTDGTEVPGKTFAAEALRRVTQISAKISPNLASRLFGGYSLMVLAK